MKKKLFDLNKNSMKHGKPAMKSVKDVLWSDKKRKAATCTAAGLLAAGLITGGVFWLMPGETKASPAQTVTEVEISKTHTEDDLKGVVSGIDDKYIVQDASGIDYLHGVKVNKDIVKYVDANSSKVDLKNPGEYKITYSVTVKTDKLNKRLNKDTDENAKESEKIVIDKTITVVTPEEAQKLADEGKVVIGDNNETVPKSDGTAVEVPETETPVENAATPTPTPAPQGNKPSGSGNASTSNGSSSSSSSSSSGSSSSGNTNTGSNTGSSGNSGSSSSGNSGGGNSGGSTAPEKPAHSHSWTPVTSVVHHEAQGHNETQVVQAAYDEPIYENRSICNGCGKDITNNIEHIFECDPGSYSNKNVQVGTKHHDAVTKQVWVVDKAAWDETVTTGHKCSCGATK